MAQARLAVIDSRAFLIDAAQLLNGSKVSLMFPGTGCESAVVVVRIDEADDVYFDRASQIRLCSPAPFETIWNCLITADALRGRQGAAVSIPATIA